MIPSPLLPWSLSFSQFFFLNLKKRDWVLNLKVRWRLYCFEFDSSVFLGMFGGHKFETDFFGSMQAAQEFLDALLSCCKFKETTIRHELWYGEGEAGEVLTWRRRLCTDACFVGYIHIWSNNYLTLIFGFDLFSF